MSPFFSQTQHAVGTQVCGALSTGTEFKLPKEHQIRVGKDRSEDSGMMQHVGGAAALSSPAGTPIMFVAVS